MTDQVLDGQQKHQQRLAATYVRVIFANLSAVLSAAVDDGLIAKNPCRAGSVKPPPPDRRRVQPWPGGRVAAVREALPNRYAVLVDMCAGLGLRQGEAFGLAVDDVDFLRSIVHVRRQVKILGSRQVFALPTAAGSGTCRCQSPCRSAWPRTYSSRCAVDGFSRALDVPSGGG